MSFVLENPLVAISYALPVPSLTPLATPFVTAAVADCVVVTP